MVLELLTSPLACFVTLTYSDEFLPKDRSLHKPDLQKFLKRLRFHAKREVRYYACGEYGEGKGRPHFHLILYGLTFSDKALIEKAWEKGKVHVGTAEPNSITYVAGYVAKQKGYRTREEWKKCGLTPEFALMSRRPGLGQKGLEMIAGQLEKSGAVAAFRRAGQVPSMFQMGKKPMPLDRYSRLKLCKMLGFSDAERRYAADGRTLETVAEVRVKGVKRYIEEYKARLIAEEGKRSIERKRQL